MRTFSFLFLTFLTLSGFAATDLSFSQEFPEFAKLNLSAQVEQKTSKKFENLYELQNQYALKVNLGQISKIQYEYLMAHYGRRSQVSYDAKRNYDLSDFLPPSMQAVIDQTFTPVNYSFEMLYDEKFDSLLETDSGMDLWALRKNGLGTATNCWNTTFENLNAILFNKTTYRLTVPPRWTANDEVDTSSQVIAESDVQLWDMLVIREKSHLAEDFAMLMHTAIFLNKNVVFEKTDSSENDPYRMSLVKDVLAKYKTIFGDNLVVEYRRATLPFLAEETYLQDPIILELIKKNHPDVDTNFIISGCETGLGGGCDVYLTAVVPTEIITYKKTGRGVLKGPKRILESFSPL